MVHRLRQTLTSPPGQLFAWLFLATGVGAIIRLLLAPLARPALLVFDEIYYIPQTLAMLHPVAGQDMGTTAQGILPRSMADFSVISGDLHASLDIFLHPPFGKWLIALGAFPFAPTDPVGWRLSAVIAGLLLIAATGFLAWQLTRSVGAAAVAAFVVALDGQGIVMSRIGMLDIFLALFTVLIASAFISFWRAPTRSRRLLAAAGVGLLLAFACGVKLSAVFLVPVLLLGLLAWALNTKKVRSAFAAAGVALGAFIPAYFIPWYLTNLGAYFKGGGDFFAKTAQIIEYHFSTIATSAGATTSAFADNFPASWIFQTPEEFVTICKDEACAKIISGGFPFMWFVMFSSLLLLTVALLLRRWPVKGWLVVAFAAAIILPWFLFPERTRYIYYTISVLPFLAVSFAWWARHFWRKAGRIMRILMALAGCLLLLAGPALMLPQWLFI